MDAQELPEALTERPAGSLDSKTSCPCVAQRLPPLCHPGCAQEVIDLLLSTPGAVDGEETDLLLDLRWLLRNREQAEAVLRLFCELRRRLEHRHYLVFYRLRRWFERHIEARLDFPDREGGVRIPLRLGFYCVEAVRRALMCSAISGGAAPGRARLSFKFVDS
jgi:hypothetical protein